MAQPFLYLASPCYGGLAHVGYMRAVLALRAACAERDIALQLDLGGGEALISRARAGMLARFLATEATHLLFVDGDVAFDAAGILRQLDAGEPLSWVSDRILLVCRDVAERMVRAHPEMQAGLGDVRNSIGARAAMVFETILDPETGNYLPDLAAFSRRWRLLANHVATL